MTIKRGLVPGNYYHIYNRGTSKQKIFLDDSDKNRFTYLLYLCNGDKAFKFRDINEVDLFKFSFDRGNSLVEICAWVLMENHFHILLFIPETISEENISKFFSKLTSSYLKYFNTKYKRTGNLFEGRFKSKLVNEDLYLKYLFSYIHLNPLKILNSNWKEEGLKIKNAEAYLREYKYSSLCDLVWNQKRFEGNIVTNNSKLSEIANEANTYGNLFSLIHTPGGV